MARKKPTLYMETTQVSSTRTAAEISEELIKAGALQIACDYDAGRITGLRWSMRVQRKDLLFAMPVRVQPVFKIINGRRTYPGQHHKNDLEQAERVAWRQLLRWVQAQLAMIDCGMTSTDEVFFSYMVHPGSGRTVYDHFLASGLDLRAIAPPEKTQ